MAKKIVLSVVFILMAGCGSSWAGKLSEKLPASTAIYLEVDVPTVLDGLENYVKFIDADLGETLVADVKEMNSCLQEVAAAYKFKPEILKDLSSCTGYLVLLRRSEPIVTTRTVKIPKLVQPAAPQNDFNESNVAAEESPRWTYEDKEITETVEYDFSVVIETAPGGTDGFIDQFIDFMNYRSKTKGGDGFTYQELPVDVGRLLKLNGNKGTIGVLDNYLIVSTNPPDDLWRLLREPAVPSLAEINLNRRYAQTAQPPIFRLLTDLGAFIKSGEEKLRDNLETARQAAAKEKSENPNANFYIKSFEAQAAERFVKIFEIFKKVFSIDRLRYAGMNFTFTAGRDFVNSDFRATLELEPPLAGGLTNLLDGGAKFQPPPLPAGAGCVIMSRLGSKEIYTEVINHLEPKTRQSFLGMMVMMKMQIGYDLGELLSSFSGDSYLYVGIDEKEYARTKWNPETKEFDAITAVMPLPNFLLLQGLNDPEAFAPVFSEIFTRLAAIPQAGQHIRKKVYQDTEIYIVGPDAGKPELVPDGLYNYAIVNAGPYLAAGSWETVTGLIRRVKAAEKPDPTLARLIKTHPDSNLLVYIPEAFQRKFVEMNNKNQAAQQELFLAKIDDLELPLADQELIARSKSAVKKFYRDFILLDEKMLPYIEDIAIYGGLKDNYYEIRSTNELRKPQ